MRASPTPVREEPAAAASPGPARAASEAGAAPSGPPGDVRLPFLAHLVELRNRLRSAAIAYLVVFIPVMLLGQNVVAFLARPLVRVWQKHPELGTPTLNYASLTDPFWIQVKLAAIAALLLASPFIFYQLWRFVAPGLYRREKRIVATVVGVSVLFFVGGALFGYFVVFPVAFDFFLTFARQAMGHVSGAFGFLHYTVGPAWKLQPMLMIDEYATLTIRFLLVFGIVFELPLAVVVVAWLGLVTPRKLVRFEKWALVIAFVVGALTTPDPITQACVAVPLFALYNLAILGAWFVTRGRPRPAAPDGEAASSDAPPG